MLSCRALSLSFFSVCCITAFLYYTIVPRGPHLFSGSDEVGPIRTTDAIESTQGLGEGSMLKGDEFRPETLLSAPRRTSAVPNHNGTLALYSVSTYSFESHKKTKHIRILDIATGSSSLITDEDNARSPVWIGTNNEILWLRSVEKGVTELVIGEPDRVGPSYLVASVPGSVSSIKLKSIDEQHVAIALVAEARSDGHIYNKEGQPKKRSTAMLYDSLMVRHWDRYVTPNKNAIFHGVLQKRKSHTTESQGRYTMGDLTNVMRGSHLESPIPPFGGSDHYDLSPRGVVFVAKDLELNPAMSTKSNPYFVAIEDGKYADPVKISVEGLEGASTSPAFDPTGTGVVFLQMKTNGYESDKNRLIILTDVTKPESAVEVLQSTDGAGLWDRSPGSVCWANDGKLIYLTAEEEGSVKMYQLDVSRDAGESSSLPIRLASLGSVTDVHSMGPESSQLFLSSSSFIDNSIYSILDPAPDSSYFKVVSSSSSNGSLFGLAQEQVSDMWFEGADDQKVHAWIIKPSNFDSGQRYPLAYLIHGGPQGSWEDAWSTRWNPAVFAEQGYVVVCPNPTGSTGYGQSFTDAIKNEWGGKPYEDLVKGFGYIKETLAYVDTSRAVALGASYGGYMMAWMQGHPLGREFKALVCHDGSFNLPAQLASDELYFPNHDLGGRFDLGRENMSKWQKWSPINHVNEWQTPMLVIHNELDYRLPISEGLAMFNVLQERGIKSRFLTFPDENHWVLDEENSLVWHTVVLNWINEFVGLPIYRNEGDLELEVQN